MARRYIYNEDTLSYEAVSIPIGAQLRRLLAYTLLGVALSTAAVYLFSYFFETPRSILLHRQNDELQLKYAFLMQRFRQTDATLTELLLRDNKVYRSVFEADIIPLSVREAGMNGAGRYEQLLAAPQTKVVAEASLLMDKITKKAYVQSKSFDEVSGYAHQKEQMMLCIPSIQPLNIAHRRVRISALYGPRIDPVYHVPRFHDGIDFAGPMGTPIYATGDGVVTTASYNLHGYGNLVFVDHGFGYRTRYAHLSEIKVQRGQKVKRGQPVGLMGNTGKSTGPHLHYEVLHRQHAVNPINFFGNDVSAEEFNKIIEALSGKTEGLATDY
ncbi:MAG: M23 family metallopeptidase [Prevotellaceae bacterium]|nr:M23 family metallopeptidase [Prevotellaceae bacterium]